MTAELGAPAPTSRLPALDVGCEIDEFADVGKRGRLGRSERRRSEADRSVAGERLPADRRALPAGRGREPPATGSRHTTATTPALYTSVISGAMPRMRIIVVIVWMMKAPMTVPASEKRPPASDVPPMTTAKMASISRNRPVLLGSAAVASDVIISPASPANRAHTMYTVHVIERAGTPASRDASGLPPTDSSSMPSAVRRVSRAVSRRITPARRIENGNPSQ